MKSGVVALVGRPNVGKSTLLNTILKEKVAITSDKPQTTRDVILGIYNDNMTQIVFVDTPGIHKPISKLGNILNRKSYSMIGDVDLVVFIIDASTGFGRGDSFILERIKEMNKDVILVLNKVDIVRKDKLLGLINEYKDIYDFKEIVPLSSLKNDNVLELIKVLKNYMNNDQLYYDRDVITNTSINFRVSEIVREKLLNLTKDEVPHSITCYTEEFEELENIINIKVVIVIDRDNLKRIIIGKNGEMLKRVGSLARVELESFFKKKVFLELYVKTLKNWKEQDRYLVELGLKDDE